MKHLMCLQAINQEGSASVVGIIDRTAYYVDYLPLVLTPSHIKINIIWWLLLHLESSNWECPSTKQSSRKSSRKQHECTAKPCTEETLSFISDMQGLSSLTLQNTIPRDAENCTNQWNHSDIWPANALRFHLFPSQKVFTFFPVGFNAKIRPQKLRRWSTTGGTRRFLHHLVNILFGAFKSSQGWALFI